MGSRRLTSPPATLALWVTETTILKTKSSRLNAAAGTNLTTGDLSQGALDSAIGSEVKLTSRTADGQAIGHGSAQGEAENLRQHCNVYKR